MMLSPMMLHSEEITQVYAETDKIVLLIIKYCVELLKNIYF